MLIFALIALISITLYHFRLTLMLICKEQNFTIKEYKRKEKLSTALMISFVLIFFVTTIAWAFYDFYIESTFSTDAVL